MTTTATNPTNTTTSNGNGNGETAGTREREPLTAIAAISKIGKILDQLSPVDRKRVLAFVTEGNGA